ncbi:hypothetical protein Tco_0078980 [Tanacetum coccineum]
MENTPQRFDELMVVENPYHRINGIKRARSYHRIMVSSAVQWKPIRKGKDGTLRFAQEQLGHIRLEAVRHDKRSKVHNRLPLEHPGRVLAHKTEENRTSTGPEQSHPKGSCQARRSVNYERSALPQLALKPNHGQEIRW